MENFEDIIARASSEDALRYATEEVDALRVKVKKLEKKVNKLREAGAQVIFNGGGSRCEVADDVHKPCRKTGGDMMSICQTCSNKWQMEEALRDRRSDVS